MVRGSRGSVSSSSSGTIVCEAGSSDVEIREMITMGESAAEVFMEITTWIFLSVDGICSL